MTVDLTDNERQQLRIAADMLIAEFERLKELPPKALISALHKLSILGKHR